MAARQLSDGRPDGQVLGQSSTDLIGLWGQTPCDQPGAIPSVNTTAATSTTNAFGFTTSTQADAIVTTINSILTALRECGMIAT